MYFLFNVNEAKIKGSVIRRQMKKYWKTAAFERPEILWSVLVLQSFMEKKGLEFSLWLEVCWFAEMCLLEVFKSSLNTSFHPHPFSLFLGALKCFERHGKKENETCTALLLEEDLPLTHRPWLQLFLALAKLGFKKKENTQTQPKKKKNPSTYLNKTFQSGSQRHSSPAEHSEWQLRREADKCLSVQNPWRKTRWKC